MVVIDTTIVPAPTLRGTPTQVCRYHDLNQEFSNITWLHQNHQRRFKKCQESIYILTALLFTTAKVWRQLQCPSIGEQIKKTQYIHTMDYSSSKTKKKMKSCHLRQHRLTCCCCCCCQVTSVMSDSLWPHRRHPPGSPVPGILQARTLEWVAISFSNAGKWKVKVKSFSHVWLLATPWTAAHQVPLPMGFSRQEYWSGVPLPSL